MLNKIIISYAFANSGHKKAAEAISIALKTKYPKIEILEIDILKYFHSLAGKIIFQTYLKILKVIPGFWEYVYDNKKIKKSTSIFKDIIDQISIKKLKKDLESFKPDAIICTHAFFCGAFSFLKEKNLSQTPLINVITDFEIHEYWIHKNVSLYCVPNEQVKEKLIQKGISEKKIVISGIPINSIFNQSKDLEQLRIKFNLKKDLPVLLIMGGTLGLGEIKKLVCCLENSTFSFQIIVVTGKNEKLKEELEQLKKELKKEIKIFGYVECIDELMRISNIFIGKPGGLTSSEALAVELPMIIFKPLPAQEERNSQYLVQQGVALRVDDENQIGNVVKNLLQNKDELKKMKENIQKIRIPYSTSKIIEAVEKITE